jgi:ABC-type multidrug transport system ATPase subunit
MTALLSLQNVSRRYPDGRREIAVLDRVSLELNQGDSVGVYGRRRSGKSTLLRLAAGILLPDEGTIRFEGRDLASMTAGERSWLRRGAIAFVSSEDWRPETGETVIEHLIASLLSDGVSPDAARRRAHGALQELEFRRDAEEPIEGLCSAARSRVMLARALVQEPRLLILDEPALMPGLGARDRFQRVLRGAAQRRGLGLLAASQEISALQGFSTLVSIADGELCSTEESGAVLPFPTRSGQSLPR